MTAALLGALGAVPAAAAPIRGEGEANASDTKKPSPDKTRSRALLRARKAALEAALSQVEGPVDPEARKGVLSSTEAWTGAYRVLAERRDGDAVHIEVEVEIDLVRLTKRVRKREAGEGKPVFRLGDVGAAEGCGEPDAVAATVRDELSSQGGLLLDGPGESVDVALDCEPLGPVAHTHLHAARVRVVATSEGQTVAERVVPAFAVTPEGALASAVRQGLGEVAEALAVHRRGHVRLRVQSPLPAERVRRLETAMRNSVLGVDEVQLAAVERGVVELHVRGKIDADTLSRRLDELAVPGLTFTTVDVEPPDVLTIRLE